MSSRKTAQPLPPLDMANKKIRELQKQIKNLKDELEEVQTDREKFRGFFKSDFLSQLTCMREKTYYPPEAVIKKYTQLLNSCQRFYLGF